MPAEWEPHEATWIGWPHNRADWPGKFAAIPWVYGEIARAIAPGEIVRILVASKAHEAKASRLLSRVGVDPSRVAFFRFPTDRGWTRDFGPIFVRRERPRREVGVAGFGFNAWARYPNWRKDAQVAARAAKALGVPFLPVRFRGKRVVLEGGAIEVNGRGTLIATEECLLDPEVQVRNPGMDRKALEEAFRAFLGVTNVIWLGKGIAGDDTHGHVDDLCRFTGPRTVVLCRERDREGRKPPRARGEPAAAWRAPGWRTVPGPRWSPFRCPRRCASTGSGCRPATPTSTSATRRCSSPPSTTRPTGPRSGSSPTCSRTGRWSGSTPWISCGGSARCTA